MNLYQNQKEKIKKEIREITLQIRNNSKDVKFSDKLIDKLLSLKGQLDVEPTRLYIPEKDVIKEYDNDNIRIVRCKGCIIWQHKGGMSFIVKPSMRALYEYLEGMLSMKDRYDELTNEEKQIYDISYFGMSLIMQVPMFAVVDEEFFVELAEYIGDGIKKVAEKLINQPLQEETPIENAEFETKIEVVNELVNDGKDTDKDA